jgi:DNA (cytosine-5)-methyltransferase 1
MAKQISGGFMRVIDLFAGCGGMSKGFENAGFETVAAFEFWDMAADCYARNFSHPVFRNDLSDTAVAIPLVKSLSPDLIIGGPPCQDFSHAGKRIEAARADLTISFAHIIESVRPKAFVMENVDRILDSRTYSKARDVYKNAGYGITELILDASLCGVPQKRKRFFCVGVLGEKDDFLKSSLLTDLSSEPTTLRDYFGLTLDFEHYYRHPRNYSRRAIFSIDEPAPTIRGVNRPVPKGYPGHSNDTAPITSSIRSLTTLERALIQTFPADFKWVGNKTDMEQMIGNAVPVKLAEYVAVHLKKHLETHKLPNESEFFKGLVQTKTIMTAAQEMFCHE